MRGSVRFIGFGAAHPPPDELVSNEEAFGRLRQNGVDVTPRHELTIRESVGIRTRWASTLTTTELAYLASQQACADAERRCPGFRREHIRLVHCGSSTPGRSVPASACELQARLGIPPRTCEARDILASCCSWTEGAILAEARMRFAGIPYALAAVGEVTFSRANPPTSLDYALWDDGGGASILEYDPHGDPDYGIIGTLSLSDGDQTGLLGMHGLGTDFPVGEHPDASLRGKGRQIQHYCLENVPGAVKFALEIKGETVSPHTFFLPHNTNLRMVHRLGELIGVPEARTLTVLGERGNQSSASIPVTLDHYAGRGTFKRGDLLILAAFGGGMLISIVLYRWP